MSQLGGNSTACGEASLPESVCCAGSEWPTSGTCECNTAPIGCSAAGGEQCYCGPYRRGTASCVPGVGFPATAECCMKNLAVLKPDGTSPLAGETAQSLHCVCGGECTGATLTSCTPSDVPALDACPAGKQKVDACNFVGPPPSTSGSSASSGASGSSSGSSGSGGCSKTPSCTSDSDCHDKCKRCDRCSGSCVSRLGC